MENYCLECVENYKRVAEKVALATVKSGRKAGSVRLMAVTKTVGAPAIEAVLRAGCDLMGENRVQELQQKHDALAAVAKEVHLIGHLQTNKAKYLPGLCTTVESIDDEKTAQAVSRAFAAKGLVAEGYVEVNIGGEESKSGVAPERLPELLYNISTLPGLRIKGLMTIPPISQGAELAGYFRRMYKLYVDMKAQKIDNVDIQALSMGMTADYEEAIAQGATIVRVGTGIFGRRQYN